MTGLPADSSSLVQAVLQALSFEHDGMTVGQRSTLDLEDSGEISWTVSDDPANLRVKLSASITGGTVSSFNGRAGAVAPQAGDYSAAMVSDAADKSSAADQVFSGLVQAPNLAGVKVFASVSGNPAAVTPNIGYLLDEYELTSGNGVHFNPPAGVITDRPQLKLLQLWNVSGAAINPTFDADYIGPSLPLIPNGSTVIWLFFAYGVFPKLVQLAATPTFVP